MNINYELAEEEARVAAIYPLGAMGDPDNAPDWLEELYSDLCDLNDPLFEVFPELKKLQEKGCDNVLEWAHALFGAGRSGFLVSLEVCVRDYRGKSGVFYSGWGHYQVHWLHVEDIATLPEVLLASARQQHEAEALKAGAE